MSAMYDMRQPKNLIVGDVVIPDKLPIPPYLAPKKGIITTVLHNDEYNVRFGEAVIPMHRHMLTLWNPFLQVGDRVTLVMDPPEQVESLLRISTPNEALDDIGTIIKVDGGRDSRNDWAEIAPTLENRNEHSFWYYTVRWDHGHVQRFLHDGDLARAEEG